MLGEGVGLRRRKTTMGSLNRKLKRNQRLRRLPRSWPIRGKFDDIELPRVETLAKMTGLSAHAVQESLGRLQAAGFISAIPEDD
jgi:hypothetical protein